MKSLQDISIYLGNVCNFNCTYCDRRYVKSLGNQKMQAFQIPHIIDFFKKLDELPEMISFHGGEPFLYVDIMDGILDRLAEIDYKPRIFIQTNGSMLLKHRDFLDKWKDYLFVSISFDFAFQGLNRTEFPIVETIQTLNEFNIGVQLQYVMPLNNKQVFSLQAIDSILEVWKSCKVESLNLIPLRHIRGKDQFQVLVHDMNIQALIQELLKFIQLLYVFGINIYIDGHSGAEIDKNYFGDHKQLVLSPDGYIYPEYDFLEYRVEGSRLGSWLGIIDVQRSNSQQEQFLIPKSCLTCPQKDNCGLKFLHSLFDTQPQHDKCSTFYQGLTIAIKHLAKLKAKPTLLHHLGV
ncbi:radical SAM protein [Yersinia ruckeri]|uniref:radical SAM protein n=1 Tax=Yersinia ruckeri TaxID=29486 RepID=UPI002237F6D5|nr:radical SAM protein [Yersinia ruckeri]MCW6598676.1 radical SAM protein [Yersinia ruckeri]